MKFGKALIDGKASLVTLLGNRWINLSRAAIDQHLHVEGKPFPWMESVDELIRAGLFNRSFYRRITEFCQRHGRLETYLLKDAPEFLLPWRPDKIIAIGRNFHAHVAEFDNKLPQEPVYFNKAPSACIGPGEPVVIRSEYGRVDHEGELGVVIGRRASRIAAAEARNHIAGYTLVNDVTARDIQRRDMGEGNPWFRSKSIDTFCPMGPVVVMADTLDWPVREELVVRVNGAERQHSNTDKFIFDIPALLEAVTRLITLEPGDLVSTGTPEGVSPLHGGDIVEVESPEIGILRNPVVLAP